MSHFFERIDNKILDYEDEISKIYSLLNEKYALTSAIRIINSYCFRKLPLSGNYLTLESMLDDIVEDDNLDCQNRFVCMSEIVLSVWEQTDSRMIDSYSESKFLWKQLNALKNLIEFDLSKLNLECKFIVNSYGKVASIGPKNELLESVVESISDTNVEHQLIIYNSVSAKGKINEKENILCAIYSFVEGYLKDKQLLQMNERLFENVSFLYNNLNMKHNNDKCNDTFFFQETLSDREKWLDDLFHLVLMVIASKQECDINQSINDLKAKKKKIK